MTIPSEGKRVRGSSIQAYGLLYEGAPLCVYRSSSDLCVHEHYHLSKDEGMPYIVNPHTLRYYLTKYREWSDHADLDPQHAPEDYDALLDKAVPCHIKVSVDRADPSKNKDMFSMKVETCPLDKPLEPYKVLPRDCLDDTFSGPINTRIIKKLHYTPPDLGGEYVDRHGHCVDTYINSSNNFHLFHRERHDIMFFPTLDMGLVLSNRFPPEDDYDY